MAAALLTAPSSLSASSYPTQLLSSADLASLSQKARESFSKGHLVEALSTYLQLIAHEEEAYGPRSLRTAASYCQAGILYARMDKLDRAEVYFSKALAVQTWQGPELDASVTREHLAQVYESRGKLREARALRLVGAPDSMVCSNREVGFVSVLSGSFGVLMHQHYAVPRQDIQIP